MEQTRNSDRRYPLGIAAIAGQMGAAAKDGFILEQPNIQVFERKAKETEPATQVKAEVAEAGASQPPSVTSEAKAPQAETKLPAPQTETKPKKIGKFNVEVR